MEAAALSNLSYVYLHTGFGEDAIQAAQRALDIFSRLGDKRGERLALLNLSAATGMSDSGDLEEQRALAEAVIAKADERGDLRLKAGGLNHLARAQRRAGNPAGAQRSTEEAIGLCQQIGAIEAELMNIANLGNALLDQERLDEAERAYQESLLRAREHGLKRQEAHCLELLARLKHQRGLYEESVLLARQAVEMFEQLGDFLRIASTQDKLARSYACLGQKESAAQAYEASGKNYQVTKQWSDAACGYQQAAALWNELGRIDVAARCALQGAECAMHSDDPGAAANLLAEATNSYPGVDCLYLEVLKKLLSDNHPTSFSRFMINFASLCKARNDLFSKERFKTGIEMCVGALEAESRAKVANALAVGLEQAQGLLPSSEVDRLAGLVADSVEHLHYRSDLPDLRTWTIGMPWKKPIVVQLVDAVDEPIGRRLAMAIALILLANEEALENTVEQFGGNQESGFMLQIFARKEVDKAGVRIESSANPNIQAFVPESDIPWNQAQPPTALIVDDRYDEFSDWSRNPGSKTFLWVLMNVFGAFVGHCSHRKRGYPGFAGKASEFCQLIF